MSLDPFDHRRRVATLVACLTLAGMPLAYAGDAVTIEQLREEVRVLRAEQAERERRLQRLESTLAALAGDAEPQGEAAAPPTPPVRHSLASAMPVATPEPSARLKVTGDLRLRGQADWSDDDGRNRGSVQLRGRLGATYAVSDRITVGARLATGDSDDPNSSDVQLSNWLDDLEASLDMAYVQFNFDRLTLYGGKMPQPFVRSDLVWDGDVNPQGLGAIWRQPQANGGSLRANALAFVVDESAGGPDSTMLGAQLGYESPRTGDWKFDIYGAYYHYDLGSLAGADGGDLRTNLLGVDGRYLSDFRLANLLMGVGYSGWSERWPLRLGVDYVRNLGAATDADTGYGADLSIGTTSAPGDWKFTYGYAVAQADAVLAAFSQDNIGIGTNYRMHGLTIDYVPVPSTQLSLYWYHYKPYSDRYPVGHDPDDWLDRLRLAFLVSF